jgi:hypothetical protein
MFVGVLKFWKLGSFKNFKNSEFLWIFNFNEFQISEILKQWKIENLKVWWFEKLNVLFVWNEAYEILKKSESSETWEFGVLNLEFGLVESG